MTDIAHIKIGILPYGLYGLFVVLYCFKKFKIEIRVDIASYITNILTASGIARTSRASMPQRYAGIASWSGHQHVA